MAPVVSAVTNFLLVVFGGTSAAATVAAMVAANAIVYIGGNLLLMKVAQALGPKVPRATSRPPDVEYSDTVAPRRIVYGENKISGMNVIPAIVTGSKGEYLHQVLALVGHEVNAINTVYFNDEALTLDGSGNVTTGSFVGKASVRKYTGTSTQTVDSILNAAITEWDSDHRGRGIAYLALRYTFDQEVYRNGKPDVTCIVQGKKCYDPRLDTSPGANPTNSSYVAYTTNPALCLADYLMASYGLSESASRVDWSSVVTAANVCDENVAIPGSTTQKRYTCNLVLEATAEFENNIQALTQAMMGACYYSGGKWRMAAGAWSTSAFSLTEDDIIGQVTVQTAQSRKREGYYNAVRGQFVDKDRNYQPVEFEPILNSTYENQDGERIYTEVAFPACNNQYEAQRNAIILSRQSRRQKTVQVVCSLNAYKIRPFETGTVTIAEVGWSNQTVRCIGWKFRPEPAIELTLIEASSTDYSDPSTGTYVTPASVAVSDPATYSPGSPQSFTATQEIESILLSWAAPSNSVPGILYRVYQYTSSTPFSSATQIYEGADTQLRVPRTDTDTRYFWVQSYYGVTGGTSDPTPSGAGLSSSGKIATLSGYLTNEAIVLPADSSGNISSYADAVGQFKLFSGPTDVTNVATFAIVSETNVDGDLNTADNTPVSGQPKGYYRVTTLTGNIGEFEMSASYGGVTINKVFSVAKASEGTDGKDGVSIQLTTPSLSVPSNSDGSSPDLTNAVTTVVITEGSTDVSSSWSVSATPSAGVTGSLSTRTYTVSGLTVDAGYVDFTATRTGYSNLTVRFSLVKAKSGTNGTDGTPAVSIVLSNTAAQLFAYADGTVPDYSLAAGYLTVYSGATDVTASATLSATGSTGVTGTINTAANTPVSGQPVGYYRVTSLTEDIGTLELTAIYNSVTYTATFSLSKVLTGYEIVGTLPSTNLFEGRIVFLTTDDKLYRYTGSAWTAAVSGADITAGTLQTASFASSIEPVTIVSSVPGTKSTNSIFNTSDGKLYRWNGSSYVATVASTDISGTISDAQIAAVAASKVTGQLTDAQLAAIAAAKVTGTLSASQLAVSIGGGNLLPNTAFKNFTSGTPDSWGIYNNGGISVSASVNTGGLFGTNYFRITANASTSDTLGLFTQTGISGGGVISWTPGLTYVISFWARAANASAAGFKMYGLYSNMGWSSATELQNPDLINGTWQRYVWRVQPDNNANTQYGEFYISYLTNATLPSGASFDICGVQVEQGEIVSAYAPKPDEILPGTITATEIADDAITSPKIVAGAIVAGKIAANAVSANEIAAGSITTAKIAAGAITSNEIAANTITAADIAAGTITATELAAGSVTTAKIAAGAITANEIAAATITGAKIAANTITASNIAADTITAGQIAAGAISTDELAANSVVASKLLVTGIGNSITNDPNTQDISAWTGGTLAIVSDSTSPTGSALQVTSVSATTFSDKRFQIDATKNYNARIYCKQVSGTPLSYLLIAFYDAAGNLLVGSTYPTGWPSAGTYHYFGRINELIPSSWTEYQISFGPDETAKIPTGATSLRIGALANYSGSGTANFTRFMVSQKSNGELIVDGSISADKIAANAVTADKINAGAVTAAKISVTNLAAISADLGSITAGTIVLPSGGFIRSGQTAYNTGTGFYIGNDSGTPKFSFGNASGKNIRWDGSDLTVNGGIILTGSVAANAITASATDLPSDVTLTSANSGVDNTLSTITITATGSTNMLIRCDLTFKFTLASGALINIYKIYRGSTLLVDIPITSLASGGTYRVPLQYMDTPSAGSTTYYIKVEPTLGGSTTYIYEDIISVVTEFKR